MSIKHRDCGMQATAVKAAKPDTSKDMVWFEQYNRLDTTSSQLLKELLKVIHPVVFSEVALKNLKTPGQR